MRGQDRRPEAPEALRRILRASVGTSEADTVDAELAEGFRARVERDGLSSARRWYLRQVVGFAGRLPLPMACN